MKWAEVTSLTMVAGVLVAAATAWVWYLLRLPSRKPLLDYSERRPVPWGMTDIAAVVVIAIAVQVTGFGIWQQFGGSPQSIETGDASVMVAFSITSLITWGLGLAFVCWRTGASLADFGCSRPIDLDIRQGVIAFCLLLIPVFGVQLMLAKLWQESQHPLIDMLKEKPDSLTFLSSAFAAVLVAPLVEEFFFRVVVQGWLENIACLLRQKQSPQIVSPQLANTVFVGTWAHQQPTVPSAAESHSTDGDIDGEVGNPYYASHVAANADEMEPVEQATTLDDLEMRPAVWPILVSAALFALAHFGNGPDPIPLFILALGLGYLYQQTHRVWPCIVVHMLLNGLSMAQLWLYTQS
jgi:membrane protease YdiL (CAAX protease family)